MNTAEQDIIVSLSDARPEGLSGSITAPSNRGDLLLTCRVWLGRHQLNAPNASSVWEDGSNSDARRFKFKVNFAADSFRRQVIAALAASSLEGEDRQSLALKAAVVEECTGQEFRIIFGEFFSAERSHDEWCAFFDADDLEISAHLLGSGNLVTPAPEFPQQTLPIAFYLPQFHSVPENDTWWGPGFTEWTNVVVNRKLFPDHEVPILPSDLGFYDLRLREVREAQAKLAKLYGVYGFCYYFYWFAGRRILERPLELVLRDGHPDMPFCLCWANEHWSRRWDGSESEKLIDQSHDAVQDLAILADLLPYFEDPRYIRIEGKPLLLIYHLRLMQDPSKFVSALRERALETGLPGLFICSVLTFGVHDPRAWGCDAAAEFPPHGIVADEIVPSSLGASDAFVGKIFDMKSVVEHAIDTVHPFPYFPGVMPRWDNTARRGEKGHVFHYASPELFEQWARIAARRTQSLNPSAPLFFVNSWNEWGEGANLEPDRRFKREYLDSLRRVVADDEAVSISTTGRGAAAELSGRLLMENTLLVSALRKKKAFTRTDKLFKGRPPVDASLNTYAGVLGNVDGVNGAAVRTHYVLHRWTGLHLWGWAVTSSKRRRPFLSSSESPILDQPDFLFVILSSRDSGTDYYGPVFDRSPRPDVLAHHGWPAADVLPGFSAHLDTTSVRAGVYDLALLLVNSLGAWRFETEIKVTIVA